MSEKPILTKNKINMKSRAYSFRIHTRILIIIRLIIY